MQHARHNAEGHADPSEVQAESSLGFTVHSLSSLDMGLSEFSNSKGRVIRPLHLKSGMFKQNKRL